MTLRDQIQDGRCPLLCELFSIRDFLPLLDQRNINCDEAQLEAMTGNGFIASGRERLSRAHLFMVALLMRYTRIEWFPWDEQADLAKEIYRRVEENRKEWTGLREDAKHIEPFFAWLEEGGEFPGAAAVRLHKMLRRAGTLRSYRVEIAKLAEADSSWRQSPGEVLAAAELIRLRAEMERVMLLAQEAGESLPSGLVKGGLMLPEPPGERGQRALRAIPDMDGDTGRIGMFLAQRDQLIRSRDWPELLDHFEEAESLFASDRAQREWQVALGRLCMDRLDNRRGGIFHFEQALEKRWDGEIAHDLELLYEKEENWEALESLLTRCVENAANDEERVEDQLKQARVRAMKLDRALDAEAAFAEALGASDGSRAQARFMIDELIESGHAGVDFDTKMLVHIAESYSGEALPASYKNLVAEVGGRELNEAQNARLLLALAYVERGEGETRDAFETLKKAFSMLPESAAVHTALGTVAHELGEVEALVALYDEVYASDVGVGTKVVLAEHLGRLELELEHYERALTFLEMAKQAQEGNTELLVLLAEVHRRLQQPTAAIAVLEELRGHSEGDAAAGIAEIIDAIREEMIAEDPESALADLRETFDKDKTLNNAKELISFARVAPVALALEAAELVRARVKIFKLEAELEAVYRRLLEEAGEELEVRPLLEAVIDLVKGDPQRRIEAIPLYARLYAMEPTPSTQAKVTSLLISKSGKEAWCAALEAELEREGLDNERALLRQLARSYEQLGDKEKVWDTHLRILEVDPSDTTSFLALRDHFRSDGEWLELTQLLLERVEAVEVSEGIDHLMEVGRILTEETVDLRGAYQVYQKILSSTEHEAARTAQEALLDRDVDAEQKQALFDVMEAAAEGERWMRIRAQHMEFAESQGDRARAIELGMELADRVPDEVEIWAQLEELLRAEERWAEAAAMLRRQIGLVDGERRRKMTESLAALLSEKLDGAEEAEHLMRELEGAEQERKTLEDALASAEGEARGEAARALASWMHEHGTEDEALSVYARVITEEEDRVAKTSLLLAQAESCEAWGQQEVAETALKTVLALNSREDNAADYVDALLAYYRRQSLHERLFVMLQFRLARTKNVRTQSGLLAEYANIAEVHLGKDSDAIDALFTLVALGEDEGWDALAVEMVPVRRNLVSLLGRSGEEEEAIEEAEALLEDIEEMEVDDEVGAAVRGDLAALVLRRGKLERAGALIEAGLKAAPQDSRLRLLEVALWVGKKAWQEAREGAEALLEDMSMMEKHQQQILSWLGRAYGELGEKERAQMVYGEVLSLDPENEEAKAFLAGEHAD